MTNFWNLARILSKSLQLSRTSEEVWNALLKYRWVNGSCLDAIEEASVIKHIEEELNITDCESTSFSDKDLPLLVETFSVLHFCSPSLTESIKLETFYEKLLDDGNTKTLLLATVNNMLKGNVKSKYNKDVLNQIFDELDHVYNFMLGPAILSLASTAQLRQLENSDIHFLEGFSQDIQHCLQDPSCKKLVELTNGSTGKAKVAEKTTKFVSHPIAKFIRRYGS